MYRLVFLLLFCMCFESVVAADSFSEKKVLYDLLQQRKQKFSRYLSSLDEKSGLFGSRTKKDIRNSMDVLKDIVETDNRIIGVLNRAVDFKIFEKTKMNYDLLDRDQKLQRLTDETAALRNQLNHLRGEERSATRTIRLLWLVVFLLSSALLLVIYKKTRRG